MNFNPDSDAWGINFQRTIARKNEVSLWMGWPRNQGLNRMSNAGLLTGIRNVTQGHGLDVKPYVVGTSESFPGRGDSQRHERRAGRRRSLLQPHAAAQGQPHRQHRLRAGGSRCAPGQPHALLAAVPREARFLPRWRALLRLRERGGAGGGGRQCAAATISFRSSAAGSGSTSAVRRSGSISAAS